MLEKIFGSIAKVKIMRLFIFNPDQYFTAKVIADRAKITPSQARREIGTLLKIGLIRRRINGKVQNFALNEKFELLKSLEQLLLAVSPISDKEMVQKLSRVCRLKLLVFSGIFVSNEDSKLDMLVVGDNIQRKSLERTISVFESFLGKELRYAALSAAEFKYRSNIGDRLIRDLLDYNHKVVVNRIGEFVK